MERIVVSFPRDPHNTSLQRREELAAKVILTLAAQLDVTDNAQG
jgi:hypothetical protein